MGFCSWHKEPEPCGGCADTKAEVREEAFSKDPSLKEEIDRLRATVAEYDRMLLGKEKTKEFLMAENAKLREALKELIERFDAIFTAEGLHHEELQALRKAEKVLRES